VIAGPRAFRRLSLTWQSRESACVVFRMFPALGACYPFPRREFRRWPEYGAAARGYAGRGGEETTEDGTDGDEALSARSFAKHSTQPRREDATDRRHGQGRREGCNAPRTTSADDIPRAEDLADQQPLVIDNVRLQRELREAAAAAEAASRAKDEFLAMLSHEMRSPLGAITIWASLLRMGKLPPERTAHAIESIARNAAILSRFIEELMDVSRIVSGKLALDVQSVDLAAVADAALDTVRGAADAKGIVLERLVDSSDRVAGDSTRLQQVVSNLLTNAVKFSDLGG